MFYAAGSNQSKSILPTFPLATIGSSDLVEGIGVFCVGNINSEDENAGAIADNCFKLKQTSFLERLNIDPDTPFNWSRSFEQIPRITFAAYICLEQKRDYINRYLGKEVNLFGYCWRINLSFGEISKARSRLLLVNFNLQGVNAAYGGDRHPLDREIRLNFKCRESSYWVKLSEFAAKSNATTRGTNPWIKVPLATPHTTVTSIRQLATARRARTVGGFIYLSNKGIEIKKWQTSDVKQLSFERIKQIDSHSLNGTGAIVNGSRLSYEYRNTELKIAAAEDIQPGLTIRWEFKGDRTYEGCQLPALPFEVGEEIFIQKNPSKEVLRNPGLAFDNGSQTKEAHKIYELNGVEVYRVIKKFGYCFTSIDTHAIVKKSAVFPSGTKGVTIREGDYYKIVFAPFKVFSNISRTWKQFEHQIVNRYYDRDGYLYKISYSGLRLNRLKQDSSSLEGITTLFDGMELFKSVAEAQDEESEKIKKRAIATIRLAQAYQFSESLPISKLTSYENESLRNHFPNLYAPDPDDCNFIEPKYNKIALTVENTRVVRSNPGSTADFPIAPIMVGKQSTHRRSTKIVSNFPPYRYTTEELVVNEEGEGLDKKSQITGAGENIGRPSLQQRLSYSEAIAPSRPPNALSFIPQVDSKIVYLLNSNNSDKTDQRTTNSIDFPDVFDPQLGLYAAQTELEIQNATKSDLITVSLIRPELDWNEGDRVMFDGELRVILEISFAFKVTGRKGVFSCDNYRLVLGKVFEDLKATLTTRRVGVTSYQSSSMRSLPLISIDANNTGEKELESPEDFDDGSEISETIKEQEDASSSINIEDLEEVENTIATGDDLEVDGGGSSSNSGGEEGEDEIEVDIAGGGSGEASGGGGLTGGGSGGAGGGGSGGGAVMGGGGAPGDYSYNDPVYGSQPGYGGAAVILGDEQIVFTGKYSDSQDLYRVARIASYQATLTSLVSSYAIAVTTDLYDPISFSVLAAPPGYVKLQNADRSQTAFHPSSSEEIKRISEFGSLKVVGARRIFK